MAVIQDYHTHTFFSFDGVSEPETLIAEWEKCGVTHLAVTDHADFSYGLTAGDYDAQAFTMTERFISQRSSILDIAQRHPGIDVSFGIEIGQPLYAPEAAARLARSLSFDVVLASQHEISGHEDFYFTDFTSGDKTEMLDDYFNSLPALIKWGEFDVLAHITYPFRQMYRQSVSAPIERYRDAMRTAMKLLIENGKALELNMSPVYEGFEPMPPETILRDYRELGGELLTVGSDDHRGLFRELPKAGLKIAAEAGFHFFTAYKNRVATQIKFTD